jgi:hypothetical protein
MHKKKFRHIVSNCIVQQVEANASEKTSDYSQKRLMPSGLVFAGFGGATGGVGAIMLDRKCCCIIIIIMEVAIGL